MSSADDRYRRKAKAFEEGWAKAAPGIPLTPHAEVIALAIAELETRLGDWSGSHNWGGVYKRILTNAELAILNANGVIATGTPAERGEALAAAKALLVAGKNEILRIDDSPRGFYFVWSWAFDTDAEGAARFVHVLVSTRPSVRAVIDEGSPEDVARAMYLTKYFEGSSHDPEVNIKGYANNIWRYAPAIAQALGVTGTLGGGPNAPPAPPAPPVPPAPPASSSGSIAKAIGVVAGGLGLVYLASR